MGRVLVLIMAMTLAVPTPIPHPRGYVCHRGRPRLIDGKLDEPAWQATPWSDDFVDIEGDLRPKPRFRTRMKMLWDDEYLYVGVEMAEPHVWGTLTQHDAVIFHDNDFEVFVDPDGDNHQYYEFELNALGTGWDLFLDKPYRDGGPARNEWEIPGLKSAVHITGTLNDPRDADTGWSVELAFPWKVLAEHAHRAAPPRDGEQWRINFSRVEWETQIVDGKYQKVPNKREDNWVWSPQWAIDMHRPELWGYVQFSRQRPPRRPRSGKLRSDPEWPAREQLHRLYYAQKAFSQANRRWAKTVGELEAFGFRPAPGGPVVVLEERPDGFVAYVGRGPFRVYVGHDSRMWLWAPGK